MDKSVLGRSGLRAAPLALGTVELGMDYGLKVPGSYGRPGVDEAVSLVHAALDAGIDFIDTARTYGESEQVLGRALHDRRHRAVLATKVAVHGPDKKPLEAGLLKDYMLEQLDLSLRTLRTDYVDLWQVHNVDEALLQHTEVLRQAFDAAQKAGKVRAVGGSTYGTEAPLQALATDLFDTLQVTYSVLDQRLADRVFPLAAKNEVGIIVRSVLLQGVLTERGEHLPERLAPLKQASRRFRQLVQEADLNLSPAQAALAFALANPAIGAVLVGVRSLDELQQNLPAVKAVLPPALLDELYLLRLDDEELLNPGLWGLG
jgi:1-deoxyxylulose-5-phosphate synthase